MSAKRKRKPAQRGYWILLHVGECPACGRRQGYQERCYTERPENPEERVIRMTDEETYCGCEP